MEEDYEELDVPAPPARIGQQLRAAREARGLTLEEVAAATRIPQRHLVTIEEGEFQALPARTYAIGFSRTYAKYVELNEDDVADLVRAELDAQEPLARERAPSFEPGDPARVPSRALGWLSLLAVVLVLAGLFFAARTYFTPAAELPSLVEQQQAEEAAVAAERAEAGQPPRSAAPSGPVVFTATDEAWVRFYTPDETLIEKVLAPGETYQVPTEAIRPMLRTGRPDALQITVGGRPVPRLAEQLQVMSDVPVTAEALLARGQSAAPGPSPAPGGTESSTSPTT